MHELLKYLKHKPLLLAPMAGITDHPFRCFMKEMGVGILTTELVSANGLVRSESERSQKIAYFSNKEQPVGVQIFGEDEKTLSSAAKIVERMGASFIDLNLGCPVPKIIKKGAGSAMLKDPLLLAKVLNSIKKSVQIPFTIKVRTGWNESSKNSLEIAHIAHNEGCTWMTIHGRSRAQGYSGLSNWNYIAEVKSRASIPIIGNGDLVHPKQIQILYEKTQCDGMMIGRGCLRNPWIFLETYKLLLGDDFKKKNYPYLLDLLFNYLDSFYNERMALIQFKKLSTWFSSGLPESSHFRKNIFTIKEKQEVLSYVQGYFSQWGEEDKEPVEYEPFLLQGHG